MQGATRFSDVLPSDSVHCFRRRVVGTIAYGYMKQGPGWLLIGWPFGLAAVFIIQGFILRAFPPKLEPHAQGNIWLKLT
jgi:hypothetical protein